MSEPRRIGTIFKQRGTIDLFSTDHRIPIFTYRVSKHIIVARYRDDMVGTLAEELECLDIEHEEPTGEDYIRQMAKNAPLEAV